MSLRHLLLDHRADPAGDGQHLRSVEIGTLELPGAAHRARHDDPRRRGTVAITVAARRIPVQIRAR